MLGYWPIAHSFQGAQDVEFGAVLNVWFGHCKHTAFALAVAGVVVVVPAGQTITALHLFAFSVEVNVPVAQAAQVRSVLVSPSATTEVPTTHVVLAMQGVPGWPSSSQVPGRHATGVVVPPGQN